MCEWSENYPDENTIAFDLNNWDLFVMKNDKKEIVATISIDHDDAVEALERLLDGQDGVVVGRVSDFAVKNRNDAVRIFLCVDKTSRIKRIMDKHGISESKVKSLVEETDARRRSYHDYYSGENWGYSGHYDLCLDEVKLGMAFAGGSIGALLGMLVFRHKIRKNYFSVGVPIILMMQVVLLMCAVNLL